MEWSLDLTKKDLEMSDFKEAYVLYHIIDEFLLSIWSLFNDKDILKEIQTCINVKIEEMKQNYNDPTKVYLIKKNIKELQILFEGK